MSNIKIIKKNKYKNKKKQRKRHKTRIRSSRGTRGARGTRGTRGTRTRKRKRKKTRTRKRKKTKTKKILKRGENKKETNKNYDMVIIGGGITGLYLYYQLLKKKSDKNKKSCLFEKSFEVGGRVKTMSVQTPDGEKHKFEIGAGRFSGEHKHLITLIKEFGLSKKMIPISGDTKFVTKNKKLLRFKKSPYQYFDELVKLSRNDSPDELRKITFKDLCEKKLGKKITNYLTLSYAYNDEFITNAYDGLRLYMKTMNPSTNQYYVLAGGLSQLTDELKKRIIKMGGSIRTSCEVKDIKRMSRKKTPSSHFSMNIVDKNKISSHPIKTKKIYLAIPKPALQKFKILLPAKKLINSVGQSSLNRIYAVFPSDEKGKYWFEGLGKMNTDSELRFIIPIDQKRGSIMISYGDEEYAKYWGKETRKNEKSRWVKKIMELTRYLFGEKVPEPIWIESYFWENGVSYWEKDADSEAVTRAMMQPLGEEVDLYSCGENYSMTNAWIEGGFETVHNLLSLKN